MFAGALFPLSVVTSRCLLQWPLCRRLLLGKVAAAAAAAAAAMFVFLLLVLMLLLMVAHASLAAAAHDERCFGVRLGAWPDEAEAEARPC